jgi:hypothetical protein
MVVVVAAATMGLMKFMLKYAGLFYSLSFKGHPLQFKLEDN